MPEGVLFVHNNFPAQFRDLVETLLARGVRCWAIGQAHAPGQTGVRIARYQLPRSSTPGILPEATRPEADLIRALGALEAAQVLRAEGCDPAVIVAHPGWGEALHLHQVFPEARRVLFAEFFYRASGLDVGFDPEMGAASPELVRTVNAKGMAMSLAFAWADAIVSPTRFQASTLPPAFRDRARIIHEGVDVDVIRPAPAEPFELPDGRVLQPGTPVITYVNQKLEPMRGVHIFARALPRLMAEVPNAHVLVIGEAAKRGYGAAAPDGMTWKEWAFRDLALDPARLHFLGRLPHARMHAAMRLGTAHVYYSYPFVLSWSLAEAMALGCYVVGSDTPPLHDAIEDGVNGRLLPFFDHDALAGALIEACRNPEASAPLRAAARETAVERFSRTKGRAGWLALLQELGLEIPT
ncbi:glycosyl transferase, group 1 [Phenylobacterium zucineum HLK1]|uniref:Glycosyl transferase, group 1 n=1 Tax=Phenylobacterium zucineum (strain HLK1) TaxID=450851 RepID=B4RBR5_PHEZH|nr:glycosyltransferase [Phenylobacterium zucineum]ACG78112.1 glycosyl transferase, group 1 [Phenylobacterium zucineum HLK1]